MDTEYASTFGEIRYNDTALFVEQVDAPAAPDGLGWELVAATPTGHVKYSRMAIVWTWRRAASPPTPTEAPR